MDDKSILKILSGESKDLKNLRKNIDIVKEFLVLVNRIDSLPETNRKLYDESLSHFQVVAKGIPLQQLERYCIAFFGAPVKRAGESAPFRLKFNPSVKYMGEVRIDQTFFIRKTKTGDFYGAILPWIRKSEYQTLHLGYYSKTLSDQDYNKIEELVRKSTHTRIIEEMEAGIGGQIHGISLTAFLQMSEMEKTTCTLKVKSGDNTGYLYLNNGNLVDSKTGELQGRDAAYQIINWDNVNIEIDKESKKHKKVINEPLMHILMESLKIKDEAESEEIKATPAEQIPAKEIADEDVKPAEKEALAEEAAETPSEEMVEKEEAPEALGTLKRWIRDPAKKRLLRLSSLGVALVLIISFGSWFSVRWIKSSRMKKEYQAILEKVEKQPELAEKENMLTDFINSHEPGAFTGKVHQKLNEIRVLMDKNLYNETIDKVKALPLTFDYDKKAKAFYDHYLVQFPKGKYAVKMNRHISEIPKLVDDTQYNHLATTEWGNEEEKIEAYKQYLYNHPKGKHRDEVEGFLIEIIEDRYNGIKQGINSCEQKKEWAPCIGQCNTFLTSFDNTYRTAEIREIRDSMQDKQDLAKLHQKAETKGTDYAAIIKIYAGYVDRNPDSSIKPVVREEISRLEKQIKDKRNWETTLAYSRDPAIDIAKKIERLGQYTDQNRSGPYLNEARSLLDHLQKLKRDADRKQQLETEQEKKEALLRRETVQKQQQRARLNREFSRIRGEIKLSGGKYVDNGNGTLTDKRTGMMWCILDSTIVSGKCLNYQSALQYVNGLTTGGFTDWRLPTFSELAGIYKQYPYFPSGSTKWFWTSETFIKGYHEMVGIVTSRQEDVFEREYVTTKECGTVHAVRP